MTQKKLIIEGVSTPATESAHCEHGSTLLLVGRWHGITRAQQDSLLAAIDSAPENKLVFVIAASDRSRTKRHPLTLEERREIVFGLADETGKPFEVYGVEDIKDSDLWVEHICEVVQSESDGSTTISAENARLVSSNPDVLTLFQARGYKSLVPETDGALPTDLLAAVATGGDWRKLATTRTIEVLEDSDLVPIITELFADVLLNEDGELSHGRDFSVYSSGMDASLAVKIEDICQHIRPGRIVDKGCGTGSLLIHLSELFPESEIVGMDLSRELLHMSESQYYPNHNVAIVRGNIIHQRFPDGTLSTAIYSSVMHEVYSYNGYDRDQVRMALANTHRELRVGGRLIIRDGIKPVGGQVWMRTDAETEARFRRFAIDFKNKSKSPGVRFTEHRLDGETWFYLSLHDANEFLSKKDYLANWNAEVNEEFGVFTTDEWAQELEAHSYRVVEIRSYLNPWIRDNRYEGRVVLFADADGAPGARLDYPDTTAVIVAEKRAD